ncbi:MAG: transglycosylase domain-containing protein [Bacteroidales bacterium]|nr:transglycosylase domain-containing protein [Bacteroidales bacterium]MDD3430826.1 transglycosylase domain-containing protein [Bacteroidales bacterium]MDD4361248.1 transglycosylase domain-containing protein [Bacteroidales bacterium]MDD4430806.1 transglycosylase domain-containing protein [Bacteroidales bacterium]
MLAGLVLLLVVLFLLIPLTKFKDPCSTVVYAANRELLGARIAADGQWRFAPEAEVPENYAKALMLYEDRYFYYHPGINPISLGRAFVQNIKAGQIVSGGSTLSMQVARMSRKNPPRTLSGKLLEILMAVKLELCYSKEKILALYAEVAPFGGNVVGLTAASWRYFNRPPQRLSWAEAATLAVLPNAPALIHPGRNAAELKRKRDALLGELCQKKYIDSLAYQLALAESLPRAPLLLPGLALHVVEEAHKKFPGQNVYTSIDYSLQEKSVRLLEQQGKELEQSEIHNLAALVCDVRQNCILAYAGNISAVAQLDIFVDIAQTARSSGSILKPFLYASMLHQGEILPNTLIEDVPVNFSGFTPKNFDLSYQGAVPASEALSQSLNVPAVEMLHQFGEARFLEILRKLGFTTFVYPAEHYGLSLILGGGECSLLELAGAYASLARVLNRFGSAQEYSSDDYRPLELFGNKIPEEKGDKKAIQDANNSRFLPSPTTDKPNRASIKSLKAATENQLSLPLLSAASLWCTMEALRQVNRPRERSGWKHFDSSRRLAWKTGTSFGLRDAWALGTTPDYVVAVWAGNADGEGRPGLTGLRAAAPAMFDLFDLLPQSGVWFEQPESEMSLQEICSESGYKASVYCNKKKLQSIPASGLKTSVCPYHRLLHLSKDGKYRVNASCYPLELIRSDSVFVLPPAMEWFYRKTHPAYRGLPPLMETCGEEKEYKQMEIVYPRNPYSLYIPRELDGSPGKLVVEVVHRKAAALLFWHLDDKWIGNTRGIHQMSINPGPGNHTLSIFDQQGNSLIQELRIQANARDGQPY